ncbi:hypothetical protein ACJIZ3_009901 [Penstemon smallii]|uniref:Uncharacterized protein n=1 Tax=Penstemon smallii TaxID=265156 RepID=A0ABD3TFC0_9LAMI
MMKKEIKVMVIQAVHQVIVPIVEDMIRKVVKEEIQSAQDKFLTGGNRNYADEINMSTDRTLELKFLDEVSDNVLTGKEIKGKGGTSVRVVLVDKTTGDIVENGPVASAKVEVLILEASPNDNEQTWTLEDFNDRIIKESDEKKPHIRKSKYVYLKEGVAVLCDVRLGHDSIWTKSCECRLGARIVGNFSGVVVKEARTNSFMVSDKRSKLYENHYPPCLSSEVWRLENIGKYGRPCKRLNEQGIFTVQDFRFLLSVDPQRLLEIVGGGGGAKWKATLDHAQTCVVDDKKMYLYTSPSSELTVRVVFDVLGQLRGVIRDSCYVPIDNISEVEKDCARELLLLAFENREDITYFDDEISLLHQFPYAPQLAGHMEHDDIYDPYTGFPDLGSDVGSIFGQFGDNQSLMSLIEHVYNPETFEVGSCSHQPSNGNGNGSIHIVGSMILFFVRVRRRTLDRRRNTGSEDTRAQRRQRISEQ